MIYISTVTGDPNGHLGINTNVDVRENNARVARSKTLDGGVVMNNSGWSVGDITVGIATKISEAQATILQYIFENYTAINLATNEGLFLAAIKRLKIKNGDMKMTILIESKENT